MPKGIHNGHRGGNYQKPLKERFDNSHQRGNCDDDCWIWIGTQNGKPKKRYGVIRDNYRQKKAHRVSYELYRGQIPEGLVVRHLCDNKLCVNPKHLELGTVSDNNRDKIGKHLYIAVKPDKYDEAVSLMKKMGYYGHLTDK
jgi:hypothetical protein